MRTLTLLLLALLMGVLPASAGLKQQQIGLLVPSAFGTDYFSGLSVGSGYAGSNVLTAAEIVVPVAFTARNMRVRAVTALTGAQTNTFTLFKNGVTTGITVTVNLATTTTIVSDLTHSASFAAGDKLALQRSGTATGTYRYSLETEMGDANTAIYSFGGKTDAMFGGPEYDAAMGGGVGSWQSTTQIDTVAVAGTITNLSLEVEAAPGVGTSRLVTIMLNGVAQDGTSGTPDTRATISGTNTSASSSFTLAVAAGSRLSVRYSTSGAATAAAGAGCVVFKSTAPGLWNFNASNGSMTTATGTTLYSYPGGFAGVFGTANTTLFDGPLASITITTLRWVVTTPPGAGKSWQLGVYKNGALTALTTLMSDTNTVAVTTGASISLGTSDTWEVQSVATNTPANTGTVTWSMALRDPVAAASFNALLVEPEFWNHP
jgi:hypothetical protein